MKKHLHFIHHRIIRPVLHLLRSGASPERLAWSITVGIIIGINPLLGSSTVATIALVALLRLNQPAAQLGVHTIYPLQLLLFLPFIRAGTILFHTGAMPLTKTQLFDLLKHHPWDLTKILWRWEWHALVVWLAVSTLLAPTVGILLTRVLKRALKPKASEKN